MSLISVIIPCFNHARYLQDAVRSFIGGETSIGMMEEQTIDDFEIIIVDDGSTDNTLEECERLSHLDKRIKFTSTGKNSGTSAANNLGLRISTGQFLTVMSADDMREKFSLHDLYTAVASNPHNFAYDNARIISGGNRQPKVWVMEEYDLAKCLQRNPCHTGSLYERRAFIDTGGFNEKMRHGREDWAWNISLGMKGYCGIHVNSAGYLYRREGQNRTLTNATPEWQEEFRSQIREIFSELYAGRFPMGCCGSRSAYYAQSNTGELMESMGLVGADGMVILRYVGGNVGQQIYYGPVTGTGYVFGALPKDCKKLVDARDVHTENSKGLLDLRLKTKKIFEQEASPVPESAKEMVAAPALATPFPIQVVTEEKKGAPSVDLIPLSDVLNAEAEVYTTLVAAGYEYAMQVLSASNKQIIAKTHLSREIVQEVKNGISEFIEKWKP